MSFGIFQFRRGTAQEWSTSNTTLLDGEMGLENDTSKFKLGDGTTPWNNLPYVAVQGIQGIQGITGMGTQGTQGIQGTFGSQGIQGIQGTFGSQGIQGITGIGTQGTQGASGSGSGDSGPQGIQGIQGIQGTTGSQGTTGANGTQGTTGTTGANGTQGTAGATGANGATGTQGTAGANGATGTQGTTGSQGTTGTTGISVIEANDGSVSTVSGSGRPVLTGLVGPGDMNTNLGTFNIQSSGSGNSYIAYSVLSQPAIGSGAVGGTGNGNSSALTFQSNNVGGSPSRVWGTTNNSHFELYEPSAGPPGPPGPPGMDYYGNQAPDGMATVTISAIYDAFLTQNPAPGSYLKYDGTNFVWEART